MDNNVTVVGKPPPLTMCTTPNWRYVPSKQVVVCTCCMWGFSLNAILALQGYLARALHTPKVAAKT